MNPVKTLSHNILYSHIGFDGAGVPVIQTSALAAAGSLEAFTAFLRTFANLHTTENWDAYSLNLLLSNFGPEFHTIKFVLTELAYSNREFHPSSFAESLHRPELWIGQSFHRLTTLSHRPAHSTTIRDVILSIAAEEAANVQTALSAAANMATSMILLDETAFAVLSSGDESV